MPSHPIDFEINPYVYSTPELTALFDEKSRYQRWLDFEASLARAQGELGIIPKAAAEDICRKAKLDMLDLEAVRAGYGKSKNSLIPLLNGLRKACEGGHGEFVHFGATTQDVIDTAESLELKQTLGIVFRDLRALEKICLDLTAKHRDTPMVARTHGQQALPTTFGLKVAVWLAEIRRHIDRVKQILPRVCIGQLGGAVGTMAALGPQAMEVGKKTMAGLGLEHRPLAWHNSRDHVGEVVSLFSLIVGTLAKIANEIFQLQKTEIGELEEPSSGKAMASSTMPHKKNPAVCERIVVLACHVRHLTAAVMESMAHEHERDARHLWAEWLAVPQICIYTGTALYYMLNVLTALEVHPDRMMRNLLIQKDMVASEWLLFRLSDSLGKTRAMEKLHELSSRGQKSGATLGACVKEDPEIGPLLTSDDFLFLSEPEKHIGLAGDIVDEVIRAVEKKRKEDLEGDINQT